MNWVGNTDGYHNLQLGKEGRMYANQGMKILHYIIICDDLYPLADLLKCDIVQQYAMSRRNFRQGNPSHGVWVPTSGLLWAM